jgi:phosphoenolpyruvate synthase/pyruvate phosphate dikinase
LAKIKIRYKNISNLVDFFVCFSDVKEWKNYIREMANYKIKPLMEYVSDFSGVGLDQVSMFTYEELKQILERGIGNISKQMVEDRFKESCFVFAIDQLSITSDSQIVRKFVDKDSNISTLKGFVAFPGKVSGIARIIVGESDFDKVKDGDVLVASTTRPDFLPVMKKTVAFITNEGGILSHAAIVARELKKPCIIGTKIATKVLKDGDLVEVDANLGTVRIIEKASKGVV